MLLFIRGKHPAGDEEPVVRVLIWIYRPVIAWVLRWKKLTIALAVVVLAASAYPAMQLGSEFMPPLNEGTLLYMPSTLPGIVGHQGGRVAADPGPDPQELSGGGVGLRQGRTRQDRDRPGAARNGRDGHQPKARGRWRAGHDDGQADRRAGPRRCSFRASATPGPCRSRPASTCSRPGSAPRSGSRSSARISARSSAWRWTSSGW